MLLHPPLPLRLPRVTPPLATPLLLVPALLGFALLGPWGAASVAACLMALVAASGRQHVAMLGWFGLALGCSGLALLLAPLVLALLLDRRVPWRHWAIAPGLAAAVLWLRQGGGDVPPPSPYAPNIWAIAHALPWVDTLPLGGLALTATVGAGAAFVAWFSVRPLHGRALVEAALLCALVTADLAPAMPPGSFVLAGLLAAAVAVADPARIRVALLVPGGMLLTLLAERGGLDHAGAIGAIPLIWATLLVARTVLHPAANDNPLMIRTA